MPKESKPKMSTKTGQSNRHAPLGQVIQDHANRDRFASMKKIPHHDGARDDDDDDDAGEELMDVKTSKRILELSREQMREVEGEQVADARKKQNKQRSVVNASSDEEDSMEGEEEEENNWIKHDEGYVSMSHTGLTLEEEALLSNMMGGGDEDEPQRKSLADIIMEKIEEKEAMTGIKDKDESELAGTELPPKVIQVSSRLFICSFKQIKSVVINDTIANAKLIKNMYSLFATSVTGLH